MAETTYEDLDLLVDSLKRTQIYDRARDSLDRNATHQVAAFYTSLAG